MDVINKTAKITNKKINYSFAKRRDGDPDKLYASSSRILKYDNKYSDLETIIKTTWDMYKK